MMKKTFCIILALVVICIAACAEPVLEQDLNGDFLTVTLEGTGWDISIEDEGVLQVATEEGENTVITVTALNPGFSGVVAGKGDEVLTWSLFANESHSLEILTDLPDEDENSVPSSVISIETDGETITFNFEGTDWGMGISDTDVIDAFNVERDEQNGTYTAVFLGGNCGTANITFSNGYDEEVYSVWVDEAGIPSLIDLTESVANRSFYFLYTADITDGVLTVSVPGEWDYDIVNDALVEASSVEYDAEADVWTAAFSSIATEGEYDVTEIIITDGNVSGTIDVYVEGEAIATYWDSTEIPEEVLDEYARYTQFRLDDIYLMEDDSIVIMGAFGEYGEQDLIGFDETVALTLAADAVVEMPSDPMDPLSEVVAVDDPVAYMDAIYAQDIDYSCYAEITVDEAGSVTGLRYFYVP